MRWHFYLFSLYLNSKFGHPLMTFSNKKYDQIKFKKSVLDKLILSITFADFFKKLTTIKYNVRNTFKIKTIFINSYLKWELC